MFIVFVVARVLVVLNISIFVSNKCLFVVFVVVVARFSIQENCVCECVLVNH